MSTPLKPFKWYRKLAIQNDMAIIGVSQGIGSAENTKWLKLSDIYGSRVAIQGSLDYAIGIGRTIDDPTEEDLRFINIPKNKLEVELSQNELVQRKKKWNPPRPKFRKGWLARYAKMVTSANTGAILKTLD